MKRFALAAALVLSLAACREDFFGPPPNDSGPGNEPRVDLIAQNLRILPGDANAIRFGIQARDGSVHVRVGRSDPTGRIVACPLRSIDDAIPAVASCLPDLPDGVREGLTMTGLAAFVLVREGGPATLDLTADYAEAGRRITVRLPSIGPAAGASCEDNECNPFFEVRPVRGGRFTATARWSGGAGRLEMLEGRVLARAFTSTGIPYRITGQAEGPGPLSVSAQLQAPSEYALALRSLSSSDLTAIEVVMAWP